MGNTRSIEQIAKIKVEIESESQPLPEELAPGLDLNEDETFTGLAVAIEKILGKSVKVYLEGEDLTLSRESLKKYSQEGKITVRIEILENTDSDYLKFIIEKDLESKLPSLPKVHFKIYKQVTPKQLVILLRRMLNLRLNEELYLFDKNKKPIPADLKINQSDSILSIYYSENYNMN